MSTTPNRTANTASAESHSRSEGSAPPRPRRRRRTLAAIVVAALVSVGSIAVAGAGGVPIQFFNDVPPQHVFFDEIQQVASACIAEGYPDGTYRPNDAVNRGAMGAFLSRSGGRIGDSFQTGGPSPSVGTPSASTMTPWTTIAAGSVVLPSGDCDRTVKLDGHTTVYMNNTVVNSCHANPCNVEIGLFIGETQVASTFTRLTSDYGGESIALTGSHTVDTTVASYTLRARAYNVKPGGAIFAARTVLGTWFPFQTDLDL